MFCSKCGKQMAAGSRFCPECGAKTETVSSQPPRFQDTWSGTRDQTPLNFNVYPRNPPRNPNHAWWCLIWPGIGHIVFGQVAKGVLLIVVSFVVNLTLPLCNFVLIPVSIIDAYKVGKCLAAGKTVGKYDWFPS